MKAELNLSNYAAKANLKNATGVDKKTDLANLKSDVDKLDIDKLKNVTSGLRSWKSKVDKLDIVKLETTPIELSEVIKKMMLLKTLKITNWLRKLVILLVVLILLILVI